MLERFLGAYLVGRRFSPPLVGYFQRPFSPSDKRRCLIVYEPKRIAFAQIYPFLHYWRTLHERFGMAVRLVPVTDAALVEERARGADVVLFQVWFSKGEEETAQIAKTLRQAAPEATLAYIDCFAHSDIRWAGALAPYIDWYLKKSVLKDRTQHQAVFNGHNLQNAWYSEHFGLGDPPTDWRVPSSTLERLRLMPSFETSAKLMPLFTGKAAPPKLDGRTYDLQARFSVGADGAYGAMRKGAMDAVDALGDLKVAKGRAELSWPAFMDELGDSTLCFSPFGYGELCWRDQEAFAAGSIVLKQDMGHLETKLDLYEPYETYVPVRWDYSDFEAKVRELLADPQLRAHIARTAFERIGTYFNEERFVDDMAFLFAEGEMKGRRQQAA
ncbi:MAG: glycosyltransferase [Pseudomonadota bacterium]